MNAQPHGFDATDMPSPRTLLPPTGASMRDAAIHYAGVLGFHVFPAPFGEKKSHKKAQYSGGREWGATTDTTEIYRDFSKRWLKNGEECQPPNVGIVTGEKSGIFVVETDTAAGHGDGVDGAASLAALEAQHGPLPPTLEAESPSGSIHRYYKHPGFNIQNSEATIAPGVDVRGDGGMVIAPPSVMPSREATADKPAKPGGVYNGATIMPSLMPRSGCWIASPPTKRRSSQLRSQASASRPEPVSANREAKSPERLRAWMGRASGAGSMTAQ
jgi:hypothetical protein